MTNEITIIARSPYEKSSKTKYHNLYIITAPSGSGKTTVGRAIFGQNNELKSFTTRKMREGETEIDYIFLSQDEFNERLADGNLAEFTIYDENYYGITTDEMQNKLTKSDCFVVVDYNGMRQIKNIYPYCTTIFLECTVEECRLNMLDRGDNIMSVNNRLKTHFIEIENKVKYDYVIRNKRGHLNSTISIVKTIVAETKSK